MVVSEQKAFYVTTPIYYVTAVPHIGNAYTTVAGDVLTRWHAQRGERTWYLTGTDEHGQKVMRSAEAQGMSPQDWTDKLVEESWKPAWRDVDIAYDDFIRTTEPRHTERVREFWQTLFDNGDVYAGEYEGPYCVDSEEFKLPADIVTDPDGTQRCSVHGTVLETVSETNYFFRLSAYADRLLALYRDRPEFVAPASARNEVVAFVEQGLQDLSITRSTFDWGIRVPWDDRHVLYVWIDALLNYVTAAGYGTDPARFAELWPADVHLVGKDILRFHAVIWPAMLMAAGVDVPRQVFAHGWLLVGGEKMSKSKLTAIAPREITDHFGSDAFRYYFLRTIAFGSDGSFSSEHLSAVYTSELANGLGNLASRIAAMVGRYFDGKLPEATDHGPAEQALADKLASTVADGGQGDRLAGVPRRAGRDQRPGRRGERLRLRAGAVEGRQGRLAAGPAGHHPLHRGRGAARCRRTAQPDDAEDRREAVDPARRRARARPARGPADPGRRHLGPAPTRRPARQGRPPLPPPRGRPHLIPEDPT